MTTEKTKHACPMCSVLALVDHCLNGKCGWFNCRNKNCDAVLDPANARGHRLHPTDPKAQRQQLRLVANKWEVTPA